MARATVVLAGPCLAYKKIDSLIRGQTLPELVACFAAGGWSRAVLAPAFPFQGRVMRGGQQFQADGAGWVPAGPVLVDALLALGLHARRHGVREAARRAA